MTLTEQILQLLNQYGWTEVPTNVFTDTSTGIWTKNVTTGPSDPKERNRPWFLQFNITAPFLSYSERLTVYISAPAINSQALNETVGPVDPLYHDIDSLTARLTQLQ